MRSPVGSTIYVGIDGGGTHVRVVVCDSSLNVIGESAGAGVNPGAAVEHLRIDRSAFRATLAQDGAALVGRRGDGVFERRAHRGKPR